MTDAAIELPEWLAALLERPVAVFGGGVSGSAARDLLRELGATVVVFDEKAEDSELRSFSEDLAKQYDLVVYSPGFPFNHAWFEIALKAGSQLICESDLGACLWKGPIIAITGTNGKTTLTEFLQTAFSSAGMEAYSCGNVGIPLSRLLVDGHNPEAIAVCEVSSFQAANAVHFKADYVLWTNFDEDHLDRHGSMSAYFDSKYKLAKIMRGDAFFYGESVLSHASKYGIELKEGGLVTDHGDIAALGVSGTVFENSPERNTYLMARALWLAMGLSEGELIEAANNFQKSPHRMELICSEEGVSYWDDSKATNFHAVFGGLSRFVKPVVWIGGGKDKGGDIGGFANRLASLVSSAHLIGETGPELCEALKEHGVEVRVYETLEAATAGACAKAVAGDNILLSPGFASLDMFDGYSHRGELFKKAINKFKML